MKKEYPEVEYLSDFFISDITKVIKDNVTIAQHKELVVNDACFEAKGWYILDIASRGDGNIVTTRNASKLSSHITVSNRKSEIQRQDQMNIHVNKPVRGLLSESKAVTWDGCYEIGIYDVRDGAYSKKNVRNGITSWPSDQCVSCVTTDPVKNHIIVGTNRRHVYVFTVQLNYSHMLTLRDVIHGALDITVQRGNLLVCCNRSDKACAVTVEESQSMLMYEFTKPDFFGWDWRPTSVCTDTNEFIYMLWNAAMSCHRGCILVQYSQDGRQLLTTRRVEGNFYRLSTFAENGTEKLLISNMIWGELYTYDLLVT
ncbi:hypothetical protein BSL78_17257 [Apostichopus japonicus]|uniref:Uncharacterized protein n=1 Tax=Stichopus japonicus TaxID=307972 RepID=A0A2G8KCZ0_STIJA|nr:hypothetical protein BSL78_17257 [Apostichopus japonicus]